MNAKIKCSNCGAEISNLNLSWGKKQVWITIPIMALGFLPLIKMTFFKGNPVKDLQISEVVTRKADEGLEIVGLITNQSGREWSGVTVEAEFFDASGAFLDEESERVSSDIMGHAKEHFKVVIRHPSPKITGEGVKSVIKVAGGHTSAF
jgi:hypothetical protein